MTKKQFIKAVLLGVVIVLPLTTVIAPLLLVAVPRLAGMVGLEGLGGLAIAVAIAIGLTVLIVLTILYQVGRRLFHSKQLGWVTLIAGFITGAIVSVVQGASFEGKVAQLQQETGQLQEQREQQTAAIQASARITKATYTLGRLFNSQGTRGVNPNPEFGELYWSITVQPTIEVATAGQYEVQTKYFTGADTTAPHVSTKQKIDLKAGTTTLDILLEPQQSENYVGYWDPQRAGAQVEFTLLRYVQPDEIESEIPDVATELYGQKLADELRPQAGYRLVTTSRFDLATGQPL